VHVKARVGEHACDSGVGEQVRSDDGVVGKDGRGGVHTGARVGGMARGSGQVTVTNG